MSVKYYDWLNQHENVRGDKVAIHDLDTGVKSTYKQLNQRAKRLAAHWQAKGIKKGDRVALLIRNCTAFFEVQFACSKIGAICLPLNWRLTANELAYILGDSTPDVMVYDHVFAEVAEPLLERCYISHGLKV
jgi:fatty-acyl-CoA synthase